MNQQGPPPPGILVVEDNKSDIYLIRDALRSAQVRAEVYVVHDGQAATEFLDAADLDSNAPHPTLVLLDMNLPKKNGAEVLRHLRRSARSRDAVVLIVSSSHTPRDRAAIADLGVSAFFRKPSEYENFMKLGPLVKELLQG